jgi:hypothetical protein
VAPGDEPSWNEAIKGPDCEKWLVACNVEVTMLNMLYTFNVVSRPHRVDIVPSHLICKNKCDTQGEIQTPSCCWVQTNVLRMKGKWRVF